MTDEPTNNPTPPTDEGTQKMDVDLYIKTIDELKATTAPLEELEKLRAENRKLTNALATGNTDGIDLPKQTRNLDEEIAGYRHILEREDLTNLEFIDTSCKLRRALMAQGHRDPGLPTNPKDMDEDAADMAKSERIFSTYEEIVEAANGDPAAFNALLMSRTQDVVIPNNNKRR